VVESPNSGPAENRGYFGAIGYILASTFPAALIAFENEDDRAPEPSMNNLPGTPESAGTGGAASPSSVPPRSPLEIVNATASKIFGGSVHSTAGGMVRNALAISKSGRFKIAGNENPRPRDRAFFNYSYFDNLVRPRVPINRALPGFEKTSVDRSSSAGLDLPFIMEVPGSSPPPSVRAPGVNGPGPGEGYGFILEPGNDGKLMGGTYATDSLDPHPDFLWAPLR
jgi:hypothetical protein